MSPAPHRRQRSLSTWLSGQSMAVVAVAVAVLLVTILWGLGLLGSNEPTEPSTAGMIAVPTVATRVPAYTRVNRDHLWDTRNNQLAAVYLPPQAVTPEMITKVADVIGRVLSHEKAPGYVFTESDFLPRGTREGLVGGIPAGKRAVRISADRVEGLFGLNVGDRFDLLATMPIDETRGSSSFNFGGVYGDQLALQARLSNWQKQATVRVMVQNGVIVEPMVTRGVPTFQSSLTDGGATRVRPVQEAVIAINPDEVARFTEAVAVQAKITAVPRSGRPDDEIESRTPELRPVSPFTGPGGPATAGQAGAGARPGSAEPFNVVETIMGQRRELTAVPRP